MSCAALQPAVAHMLTPQDAKRLASATAETALFGGVLHALEGDAGTPVYIFCWRNLTRACDSLDELEKFLVKVGARK